MEKKQYSANELIQLALNKMQPIFKNKIKSRILAFILFTFLLIVLFPAFHTSGVIIFGDIDFGFYAQSYFPRIFPLWNDLWSSSNFFNATRLFFVGIPELLRGFFFNDPGVYQKIVVWLFIQLSFFGMFIFIWQVLKFEKEKKKLYIPYSLIFLIAFGAGLFYALNPWSIMRIQHIYLLAGYAILPFIFDKILYFSEYEKIYKNKLPYSHIFAAAILYIIGIGAVHYIVFIFMFIFSWYAFMSCIYILNRQFKPLWLFTLRHILLGFTILGCIMYFIIPFIGAASISGAGPTNLNTIETINMFSRFSDLQNVLYLTSYWWAMIDFSDVGIGYKVGGAFMVGTILITNLLNYRNKYSVFFMLWAIVLIVLSTGTHGPIKYFFANLVLDNPLGSTMGSIFRDPNKFVGLLAFCYAILWALSVAYISSFLRKIRHKIQQENKSLGNKKKLLRLKARNIFLQNLVFFFLFLFFSFSLFSYSFYIKPFKQVFIDNFYSSVKIPESYKMLADYQLQDQAPGKYLYLPRYEAVQSKNHGFAVAYWNDHKDLQYKKATGAIDLSSTIKPTYQPLEGVNIFVGYFYSYIEDYLEHNVGTNLGKYLSLINVSKLVYHKDIIGIKEAQFDNLQLQKGIKKSEQLGFMHIYDVENPVGYTQVFPQNMFLFGGWTLIETLFNFDEIPHEGIAHIFTHQDKNVLPWYRNEKQQDIIVAANKLDVFMSLIGKESFISPFEFTSNYDPFFRWSVMRADIPDFRWHLKNLGFHNWNWEFDYGKGLAFTYAPSSIDIQSFDNMFDFGSDLIDYDRYQDISEIFHSNSDLLILGLDKKDKLANRSAVKGKIFRGNEEDVWKVAEMEPLNVKEKHPYTFELTLSGIGVNQLHGKVKFYDYKFEEIGVDYIVAPRYIENFEAIRFRGAFITPPGTHKIVLQVSSLQKPYQETYWWLHDIKFRDLGSYLTENIVPMQYNFAHTGRYHVFTRTLNNQKGGEIEIDINGTKFLHNTHTESKNQFEWKQLGSVTIDSAGVKEVSLKNISGFNAVNLIAFVPENQMQNLYKRYQSGMLVKPKQIIALEGENDFEAYGNGQSKTNYIHLSNGKTFNMAEGEIVRTFDIFRSGNYTIKVKGNPDRKHSSKVIFKLYQFNTTIVERNLVSPDDFEVDLGYLNPGEYSISFDIENTTKPLTETQLLGRLDGDEDHDFQKEDDEIGCSYFEGLTLPDTYYIAARDMHRTFLARGISCFWDVITNNIAIPVEEGEEYIISYNLEKEHSKKLHAKLKFYDENEIPLDDLTDEFYDHAVHADNNTHLVQKVIKIPEGAKLMRIQWLHKQRQEFYKNTRVDISNFYIYKYRDMPGIDAVLIYDSDIVKALNYSHQVSHPSEKRGKMKVELTGLNEKHNIGKTLQFSESFTRLWRLKGAVSNYEPYIVNFFLTGYKIKQDIGNPAVIEFIPKKHMIYGYSISIFTILSMLIFFIIRFFKNKR